MADKNLESFKIGDTRKPTVASPQRKVEEPEARPDDQSIGFRRIEAILETEEPAGISAALDRMRQQLEELRSGTKMNKIKASVTKALAAIDLTSELMRHLFLTKEDMIKSREGSGAATKP